MDERGHSEVFISSIVIFAIKLQAHIFSDISLLFVVINWFVFVFRKGNLPTNSISMASFCLHRGLDQAERV